MVILSDQFCFCYRISFEQNSISNNALQCPIMILFERSIVGHDLRSAMQKATQQPRPKSLNKPIKWLLIGTGQVYSLTKMFMGPTQMDFNTSFLKITAPDHHRKCIDPKKLWAVFLNCIFQQYVSTVFLACIYQLHILTEILKVTFLYSKATVATGLTTFPRSIFQTFRQPAHGRIHAN